MGFTNKPRNHREWFLHYLFTDPDFIISKNEINKSIENLVGEGSYSIMKLLTDSHSISEQLLDRFGKDKTVMKILDLIAQTAKRFQVSTFSVEQGLKYDSRLERLSFKSLPIVDIEGGYVVIRLNGTMRLSDISEVSNFIKVLQRNLPDYKDRNRSKVNPELIYAIYRQRLAGKNFREINKLYEDKELTGYKGANKITGEEALARMYRKFKPDI